LERFAMPTVFGKFESGLSAEQQAAMLATLEGLNRTTAFVFPSEFEVGTLGGQREPSTGFMESIEFHNREIARAILGQTLTTDEGRRVGSLALGKVHLQVLLLQLEGLRRELADVVMTEQVIRPMVELNFGPGDVPRFEFEPASLGAFANGAVD
jgi:phage gp29-like protein